MEHNKMGAKRDSNADAALTELRKEDHVRICIEEDVQCTRDHWQDVQLVHQALPELDMSEIDMSVSLFNCKLAAPLIINAMTGGFKAAKKLNAHLAQAAAELQIGLGVGSQRAALIDRSLKDTYAVIKDYDVPLVIANIGAPQLVRQDKEPLSLAALSKLIAMIDADVLAIHLNYLQEVVQQSDTNAKGCLSAIEQLVAGVDVPVILKETGAGISPKLAQLAKQLNVGVDVGGLGGTSFAAVEHYRAAGPFSKRLGKTFWDWGIPTPTSILNCKRAKVAPIIASGGIRTGLDGAKAIALGSDCFGMAQPLLGPAVQSANAVSAELAMIIEELKATMFLVGANSMSELRCTEVLIEPALVWG